MPIGNLDPARQTREDIQRVIDGERASEGMYSPHFVDWNEPDRCWAWMERKFMGYKARLGCDEAGDRVLGLCKRHALEILGRDDPDRVEHPGRNGVRGLEAAGVRFGSSGRRIPLRSTTPALIVPPAANV